jgi:diguanylate cyclase
MAERPDDNSANWREKYLDALDQQEHIEKSLVAQQEMLRRALVRVSVAADGQDDALDDVLNQLRERMRGAITGDISFLLARLDEVALSFEKNREQNAQDVRQSLYETIRPLQELDLTRGVKKEISQYLSQLPEHSKKVRLYPALLRQLANIQQQALKEIEQPKTGLLQKILGSKSFSKDDEQPAPLATDNNFEITSIEKPGSNSEMHSTYHAGTESLLNIPTKIFGGSDARIKPGASEQLPQIFIDQITQIINQFLNGIEKETPMVKKANLIRERLNAATSVNAFIKTWEALCDLVMEAYLLANQAFATYLKNVNQELADISNLVGGATEAETQRRHASTSLQDSMRKGMASLESGAESATDLAQLKNSVQSQIGNIRQALDHFQQAEQQQNQLASQLEMLFGKIKIMEDDAEKNRSVLEKQRFKALHDPLTELPNREYYNERVAYEYHRWERYGGSLTLAVLDIDHFKKINDSHGHQAGDRVLRVIGRSVAKRLREVDFFCRFGGEEFVAIMPETCLADALPVLDMIRSAIANASFNYKDQSISISLSIGVTEFKKGDDVESAFARADEALYAAKSSGRNCIKSM